MDLNISLMIRFATNIGASDIHIQAGSVPLFRINNELRSVDKFSEILNNEIVMKFTKENTLDYNSKDSFDGIMTLDGIRCRINCYNTINGYAVAIRIYNHQLKSMSDLRIPKSVQKLTREKSGLILFCGPTGAGKTTSIASFLNEINNICAKHIISLEDPVEIVLNQINCLISQREIGLNCLSYFDGLKSALREDPDIIFIGELRDTDTVQTALTAAETGHLVISTLHSGNAVEAIERITQFFPVTAASQVFYQIANSFRGIVCQQLISKKDNTGRIPAFEVLLNNSATRNIIRQGQTHKLKEFMSQNGMQRMEDSIQGLKDLNLI